MITEQQARAQLADLGLFDDEQFAEHILAACPSGDRSCALAAWLLNGPIEREPGDDDDLVPLGDVIAAYDRERARESQARRAVAARRLIGAVRLAALAEFETPIDDRVAALLDADDVVDDDDDEIGEVDDQTLDELVWLKQDLAECMRRRFEHEQLARGLHEQIEHEREKEGKQRFLGNYREADRCAAHLADLRRRKAKAIADRADWLAFEQAAERKFKEARR